MAGKPNVHVPKCFYPLSCYVFSIFSKDEVTGSGVDEGRGERFVPETEKDVNENVKRDTKETSGKRILLRNKFVKKNNC